MNPTPVKTIEIKEGIVYVSSLEKPVEPKLNMLDAYGEAREEKWISPLVAFESSLKAFEESFVEVSNQEIFKDSGWMYDETEYADGDNLKDGLYPAPSGLQMEVKEQLSGGWVPSYNDPDNSGFAPNAEPEFVAVCSFSEPEEKEQCADNRIHGGIDSPDCCQNPERCENKKPEPEEAKDGCKCQSCGSIYQVDLVVPDEIWEKISPNKVDGFKSGGLLCGVCIVKALENLGGADYWILTKN